MMKVKKTRLLCLVRHAKSSWDDENVSDRERPLNKRGLRDAPRMGKRLKERGILPQVIVSSPARRAADTARLIAAALGGPGDGIVFIDGLYRATVKRLEKTVRGLDDRYIRVALIGHNPELTEFAQYLTGETLEKFPTCGVFCIDFALERWKDVGRKKGAKVFFDTPRSAG